MSPHLLPPPGLSAIGRSAGVINRWVESSLVVQARSEFYGTQVKWCRILRFPIDPGQCVSVTSQPYHIICHSWSMFCEVSFSLAWSCQLSEKGSAKFKIQWALWAFLASAVASWQRNTNRIATCSFSLQKGAWITKRSFYHPLGGTPGKCSTQLRGQSMSALTSPGSA